MNKISGYKEFTLASGRVIELKFSNATTEIYARLRGFTTIKQVSDSLTPEGEEITIDYMESLRLYVFAAAKYAALAQNKPVDFNEWEVSEWIEELGERAIMSIIEQPDPEQEGEPKKKEI